MGGGGEFENSTQGIGSMLVVNSCLLLSWIDEPESGKFDMEHNKQLHQHYMLKWF